MATTDTKVLFSRGAFDINPRLSDGLYLRVGGGVFLDGYGYHGIQGAHLLLTASATNYVEVSSVGVVEGNVTGFTPGAVPLYEVKMGATTITACNDWRNADVALGGTAIAMRTEAAPLAAGDLVYVSGWDEATGLPLVTRADANVAGSQAQFVVRGAVAANANGMMYTAWRSTPTLNTGGSAEGNPVYLSETIGAWTLTPPTAADSVVQVVGHVAIVSATVGVVEFDLRDLPTVGTNDLQALAVTTAKLGADAVTNAKIGDDQIDSEHYVAGSIDTEHYAADSVTGAKIPALALGAYRNGPVAVAFNSGLDFEILAANGAVDRIVEVLGICTAAAAAAGAPDIDVGGVSVPNAIVDDFEAGSWILGDRFHGVMNLPAGEALRADVIQGGATAGAFNIYWNVLTAVVGGATQIADGVVTDPKLLALGATRSLGGRDLGRTCVGYFELTGAVADTETVVINGRTYEFDTGGAITGDVLVNVTADQTADAAITALVAAINADALRTVNSVAWVGNTDVSSGCSFVGIGPVAGVNVTLVETCGNGAVGGTPAVGGVNDQDRDAFFGQYAVTAADVVTLALAAGNSVPIAGLPTTVAPTLCGLVCRTAAGVVKSLATVAFTLVQANANFFILTVDDGAAVLANGDLIGFYLYQ
jgi:hypothetical protein